MSQVTVRLTDGRRLLARRRADQVELELEGTLIGLLTLRSVWRLSEGLDRIATSRPPASPAKRPARRRGR